MERFISDAGFVRNEETLEPSMYLNKYGGPLHDSQESPFTATAYVMLSSYYF